MREPQAFISFYFQRLSPNARKVGQNATGSSGALDIEEMRHHSPTHPPTHSLMDLLANALPRSLTHAHFPCILKIAVVFNSYLK